MHRSFVENMTTMPPLTGNAGKYCSRWQRDQGWRKEKNSVELCVIKV